MSSVPSIPPAHTPSGADASDERAVGERWDVKQWCVDMVFGIAALLVGVAGLVMPILPGWLAILVGIIVLAGRIPPLRRLLTRIVVADPSQRLLAKLAANPVTRRVMARGLLRTEVRRAVEPEARRRVVSVLVTSAERDDRSSE